VFQVGILSAKIILKPLMGLVKLQDDYPKTLQLLKFLLETELGILFQAVFGL
jgi:hypothetical protein